MLALSGWFGYDNVLIIRLRRVGQLVDIKGADVVGYLGGFVIGVM